MSRSCYLGGAVLLGALAVSCRKTPVEPPPCSSPSPSVSGGQGVRTPSPFDTIFAAAGAEFGVSPAVLRAIGWVETRWQMVAGAEEFPGRPAGFGVMALRGAALERGAALAGVTSEAARREPKANIRAAAALLSAYATESGMDSAIVRYSGIDVPAGRAAYQRDIARAHGTVTPQAVLAACPPPADTGPDYARGREFRPIFGPLQGIGPSWRLPTCKMRSRLVPPALVVVPAMATTQSPRRTSFLWRSCWIPSSTMRSAVRQWGTTTGVTPQAMVSRRQVESSGVRAMIGAEGRALLASRAEKPVWVKTASALARSS